MRNPQRQTLKCALPPTPNPKTCVTPNANPQRQSVEYRWRWVPNAKFLRWACTFHVVYVNFVGVGHPTQTQFPVEYGLKAFSKVDMPHQDPSSRAPLSMVVSEWEEYTRLEQRGGQILPNKIPKVNPNLPNASKYLDDYLICLISTMTYTIDLLGKKEPKTS